MKLLTGVISILIAFCFPNQKNSSCEIRNYDDIKRYSSKQIKGYIITIDDLCIDSLAPLNKDGNWFLIYSRKSTGSLSNINNASEVIFLNSNFKTLPNDLENKAFDFFRCRINSSKNFSFELNEKFKMKTLFLHFKKGGKLKNVHIDNSSIVKLRIVIDKGDLKPIENIVVKNSSISDLYVNTYFENVFSLASKINSLKVIQVDNIKDQNVFLSMLQKLPDIEKVIIREMSKDTCEKLNSLTKVNISNHYSAISVDSNIRQGK